MSRIIKTIALSFSNKQVFAQSIKYLTLNKAATLICTLVVRASCFSNGKLSHYKNITRYRKV